MIVTPREVKDAAASREAALLRVINYIDNYLLENFPPDYTESYKFEISSDLHIDDYILKQALNCYNKKGWIAQIESITWHPCIFTVSFKILTEEDYKNAL